MEPVGVGNKEEYLYDCYTLSHIEKSFDGVHGFEIQRKTNWVPINPFGEAGKQTSAYDGGSDDAPNGRRTVNLPAYETFDLNRSNILDEETFAMEPGIVFFEV
jgi:ELMO domain-containing protein